MIFISRIAILVSFLLPSIIFAAEPVEKNIRGITYSDIEQVWKKAPVTIANWSEQLIDPKKDLKSLPYRLYLHGIPGTGKTTLAYGIWKKVVDHDSSWELISIAAGDLISKNRGEAAKKLNEKVGDIKNKKVIIVIDEAHIMMKNHAEKSTDTEESTEAMQTLLNDNANNRNCMICLTGNEVADMKDTMQSRISFGMVEIPAPTPGELHGMFHYHTKKAGFAPNSVSDDVLLQLYNEGNIKVGRDVQSFVAVLKEYIRDNGYRGSLKKYQLTKSYLLDVAEKVYKKKMIAAGIGKKKLSDREFQQQMHDDALTHQKQLHEDALKLQKQLHDDGKKHQTRLAIGSGIGGGAISAGLTSAAISMTAAETGAAGVGATVAAAGVGTTSAGGATAGTVLSKVVISMGAAKTGAAGVGTTVVVTGAGTTSTGGAAVASTGLAAKLMVVGKGAMAAASAHPVVMTGMVGAFVVGGIVYYACSEDNTKAPNKSGVTDVSNA